jgi:hypothetical protein
MRAGDWYVEDEVERECRARLERYGRTTWAEWLVRIMFALLVMAALVGYWQVFVADGELSRRDEKRNYGDQLISLYSEVDDHPKPA